MAAAASLSRADDCTQELQKLDKASGDSTGGGGNAKTSPARHALLGDVGGAPKVRLL
jgi:hypothetical protein